MQEKKKKNKKRNRKEQEQKERKRTRRIGKRRRERERGRKAQSPVRDTCQTGGSGALLGARKKVVIISTKTGISDMGI